MTKSGRESILYRVRILSMFITVIMLGLTIAWYCNSEKGTIVNTLSFYGLICFSILSAIEIINVYITIVYQSLFVFIGNINFVIRHAIFFYSTNRLHQYKGIFLNMKEVKYINHRYGSRYGDIVIQEYAATLHKYMKKVHGVVGHLGGDNFYILIKKNRYDSFIDFLDSVVIKLQMPVETVTVPIHYRAGVIDVTPEHHIREIVLHASIALSVAKERDEKLVVFDKVMLDKYSKERQLVADSNRALEEGEFVPYYQPKVNAETRELSGSEALVRWIKNGRMISPAEFVPALEKAGAIDEIDFRVFELVCKDLRDWIDRGIEPVRVSTNFSKLHLKDPDFINKIIRIKERYNIDGKYLEVELTESAGVTDFEIIKKFAAEVKNAGMSVSIDDFGTGYSSLSMLQSVSADVVKMDKSFLDNCFNDESKQFIVDVITIVKHQEQKILFEGVETKEQLDFLKENQVDYIQGFYFDKPLCHSEFESRLINPMYPARA